MNSKSELELVERYLDGTLDSGDVAELRRLLRESDQTRAALRSLATVDFGLQDAAASYAESTATTSRIPAPATAWLPRVLLAVAAVMIGMLGVGIYVQRTGEPAPNAVSESEQRIATISGLGGSLTWTGDGGRVSWNLTNGMSLTGGTIEGTSHDAWVELDFNDGSKLTLSGTSRLVFSDFGQKELHLKQGILRGNVRPQPSGKPMLVHTRSAKLQIVGTQFDVEASVASTALSVNEGRVRLTRLSDGSSVDVPAQHRVVAAIERQLVPESIPAFTSNWKSQLHLGPTGTIGEWLPKTDDEEARLKTLASVYTSPLGDAVSVQSVGVQASSSAGSSVVLTPESYLRVRGRMTTPHELVFGLAVRRTDGGFGGNFNVIEPAKTFRAGEEFEFVVAAEEFWLNSTLVHLRDKLLKSPIGAVVDRFWCATINPVGLEIMEVELVTPETNDI